MILIFRTEIFYVGEKKYKIKKVKKNHVIVNLNWKS